MITGKQMRAARVLADWDRADLAARAGVSLMTVQNIELDTKQPRPATMSKIIGAFSEAGIEFIENEGIRRRPDGIEIFKGPERFEAFCNLVYEEVRANGGDVNLSVTDETLFSKYRRDTPAHYKRMQELYDKGIMKSFRILAHKSNFASTYSYSTYKWRPESDTFPTAFYTFSDRLALISFAHETPPYIIVLQSIPIVASYRQAFEIAWSVAKDPPTAGVDNS